MTRPFLPLLAAALLFAGCARHEPAPDAPTSAQVTNRSDAVPARMEDGVQVADLTVDERSYHPGAIALQAGVPARLMITRTSEKTCATEVHAPDLGVPKTALPLGEAVAVTFTPSAAGTFSLACGMDMMAAAVIVRS